MSAGLPETRAALLVGVAAISIGVGMLVIRYACIGLIAPLSRVWAAVLTGGAIGLIVTGAQTVRGARRSGAAPGPVALAAAATLPLAAVLGVYALVDPRLRTDPAREVLHQVAVPGLKISLPAWPVREDDAHWQLGAHRREEPGDRGRFVELRWGLFEPVPVEAYTQIFGASFRELAREPATVAGAPADTVLLERADQGKLAALTPFRCPDDPRGFHLISFLALPRDELLALHRRLLASVRCVPTADAPAPVFPSFTPPTGAVQEPNASAVIYTGPQHEVYTLSAGMPGREVLARIQQIAGLPQQMLATEFTIQQVELPAAPMLDESRATWTGRARDEAGTPLLVALTAWHCPGPDATFIGAYAGPESIAEAEALRVLLSARCP